VTVHAIGFETPVSCARHLSRAPISSSLSSVSTRCFDSIFMSSVSRDSSVGLALGYGLDDRGSRVRFPAGAGNFSLHHRVQNGSGAHPASYPMGTRGSFPEGNEMNGKRHLSTSKCRWRTKHMSLNTNIHDQNLRFIQLFRISNVLRHL
jgi:hypothetical protein